jgi:hypothetical protein
MADIENIVLPQINREINTDKSLKCRFLNEVNKMKESQVIIHCTCTGITPNYQIRIWMSTFLFAKDSNHISELVYFENITPYPIWMQVNFGKTVNFTLIFNGLPKQCKQFDLIENIPEPGGFIVKNINRNISDVYLIDLT